MILVFDDEKAIRENFIKEINGQKINLDVIQSDTKLDLKEKLNNAELMSNARVLIFDLSTSREEAESGKFDVLDLIKDNYNNYSLPIFIHSAFSDLVHGYDEVGTVFKIKKDADSITKIVNQVSVLYETGFLEIFCPKGYLENEIHKGIHKAFNLQFRGEEISQILASIKKAHPDPQQYKERTVAVFERIAIRSLYQNLISAKKIADSDQVEEVKINAVEHYYRRNSDFPVWTGDIFIDENQNQIVILTPRCDINNGVCGDNFIVCAITNLDKEIAKKIAADVNRYLNDNPQQSGIKYRFLVPAPNYIGGKIDLTKYSILNMENFQGVNRKFRYLISLSDELTNEIVRKFASYILRGGISASEISEASFYSA